MGSVIAPSWQVQYLRALSDGMLPATAARHVGTTLKLVEQWRTDSEEFDYACTQVMEELIDKVEDKAFKLALNGSQKGVYHQGVLVGEETIDNKDLIMFLLKANRSRYNDKLSVKAEVDHNITISVASFAQNPENIREVIDVAPQRLTDLV